MSIDAPTVSICLPVYNGEKYLGEAIRSVLEQDFEDFELIISDNASTDRTQEICRRALEGDCRVRYFRANVNRGLARNFNRAFAVARGRYSMWIGHDDLLGRAYVRECLEVLKKDPAAVLCFANANYIDDKGNVVKQVDPNNSGAPDRPSWRFHNVLYDGMCDPVAGLMKTEVLKQTKLHGAFADSDRVLLAEMALRGRFGLVSDYLFSKRMHTQQTTSKYKDRRERTLIFDPARAGKISFPFMLEAMELLSAIHRAKLPLKERLRCYQHLIRWLWEHRGYVRYELREGLVCVMERYVPERHVAGMKFAKVRLSRTWSV
jgi:glycosyltransferase involved in cell wall biosynthesis